MRVCLGGSPKRGPSAPSAAELEAQDFRLNSVRFKGDPAPLEGAAAVATPAFAAVSWRGGGGGRFQGPITDPMLASICVSFAHCDIARNLSMALGPFF